MGKKAILLVSFGTTYVEAITKSIESTEKYFAMNFPDYEIRRAFSSQVIIEKLAKKSNIQVESVADALRNLAAEKFEEVYVQPLQLVVDNGYKLVRDYVIDLAHRKEKVFKRIAMGRPLLTSCGIKNHPDDYAIVIEALKEHFSKLESSKAVLLMCNGSRQLEYSVLQLKLLDADVNNAYVYTIEGYPTFENVIKKLKQCKVTELIIVPFLFIVSEHVLAYMSDGKPDSPQVILEKEGFHVSVYQKGLGELSVIQEIYVQHVRDSIQALSRHHGHHKQAQEGHC